MRDWGTLKAHGLRSPVQCQRGWGGVQGGYSGLGAPLSAGLRCRGMKWPHRHLPEAGAGASDAQARLQGKDRWGRAWQDGAGPSGVRAETG